MNIFLLIIFFIFLIILLSLTYFIFLLTKILKLNQKDNANPDKFLDLQSKILENFNLLKQETLEHLKTTLEKQEKIISSTVKIEELTRNIESSAVEMRTIKEILTGPKNRGYLGEIMLEEIIRKLPSSLYEKQYRIGNEIVDYVLKLNDILIPIDAKFPIQNFNKLFDNDKDKNILKKELIRNLKNKIEDVSRKYILPLRGTIEFALIYLANEGIYYELLSDKNFDEIWDFARERSIFLTSPKNFEIICSSLFLVIRKQELSKNIRQILSQLRQLEKDIFELSQQFEKSYNQLKYSFNNLQEFERILNRFIVNFRYLIKTENKLEEKIKERSLI
ncbi:MAG: DNA recombination protein RmuC [Patescibacteria group bacterium]|nr:DNA recombination protein RmuC [Patescibacteria group bacterium]